MPACAGFPFRIISIPEHTVQKTILETFSQMCGMEQERVEIGTDGCSAPNFAIPLSNAALGFARLCDPRSLSQERAAACRRITSAMMANPVMVSGVGRFDTRVMEVCSKRILAKGGAEGYMAMGVMAGALGAEIARNWDRFQSGRWRPVSALRRWQLPQPCPPGHGAGNPEAARLHFRQGTGSPGGIRAGQAGHQCAQNSGGRIPSGISHSGITVRR